MANQNLLIHELYQKIRLMTKEMNERLREHGISSSQWSILFCLNKYGPMNQTNIWKYLNVEAPTVTRTITRMENNGWVKRLEGSDKRERIVMITERAKQALPSIEKTIQQFEQEMLMELPQTDQEKLNSLIQKLGQSLS